MATITAPRIIDEIAAANLRGDPLNEPEHIERLARQLCDVCWDRAESLLVARLSLATGAQIPSLLWGLMSVVHYVERISHATTVRLVTMLEDGQVDQRDKELICALYAFDFLELDSRDADLLHHCFTHVPLGPWASTARAREFAAIGLSCVNKHKEVQTRVRQGRLVVPDAVVHDAMSVLMVTSGDARDANSIRRLLAGWAHRVNGESPSLVGFRGRNGKAAIFEMLWCDGLDGVRVVTSLRLVRVEQARKNGTSGHL